MTLKARIKYLIFIVLAGMILWILTGYFSAKYLVKTNKVEFSDIQQLENRKIECLSFNTEDDETISAWFIDNNSDKAIILLSGIKGNRLSQIERAKFYLNNNFSVLMPDLRGTGKSSGEIISFGWHERKDLHACVKRLKQMNINKISVAGQSLGAAAIVYANIDYSEFEFIILESCYDNIESAFKNRVEKFHFPYFVFNPVEFFIEQIINEKLSSLSPENLMKNIECPILILAGDMEKQIPLNETQKIYDNCGSSQKKLHIFHTGKHEDFYSKFKLEYETVLSMFLDSL